MEEVVATRLEKNQLEIIDRLIQQGKFSNRSDAFRKLIDYGLTEFIKGVEDQYELLYGETTLSDKDLIKTASKLFDEPVADLVGKMRE